MSKIKIAIKLRKHEHSPESPDSENVNDVKSIVIIKRWVLGNFYWVERGQTRSDGQGLYIFSDDLDTVIGRLYQNRCEWLK